MRTRSLQILALLLTLSGAREAIAFKIGAAPAIIKAKTPRGVSVAQTVRITNMNEAPQRFTTAVMDLGLDGEGKASRLPPGTSKRSMASWLSFRPKTFEVPAHGELKVQVVISVPPDAEGGHEAALLFQTVTEVPGAEGSGIGVGAAMAVMLYQETAGSSERKIRVRKKALVTPTEFRRFKLELGVVNEGDVWLRADGNMVLLDRARRVVGRTKALPTAHLLPAQQGALEFAWGGTLKPGRYDAIATVSYGGARPAVHEERFVVTSSAATAKGKE